MSRVRCRRGNRVDTEPSDTTAVTLTQPTPSLFEATRARVFATGQGRRTDPVDAHSVAVAALRAKGLRQVDVDDVSVVLRLLVDR